MPRRMTLVQPRPHQANFSRRQRSLSSIPSLASAWIGQRPPAQIQERILYAQMALKYLAAAAKLHTILQLRSRRAAQQTPIDQTECLTSAT